MSTVGVSGKWVDEVGEIGIGIEWKGLVKKKYSKVSNN